MQQFPERLLVVSVPLVVLAVRPGSLEAFTLPKLLVIAVAGAVALYFGAEAIHGGWEEAPSLVRALLVAQGVLAVLVVGSALASEAPRLAVLGTTGRLVGALTVGASAVLPLALLGTGQGRRTVDRVGVVLAATLAVVALHTLVQELGLDPFYEVGLPAATLGNPNNIGAVLALGLVLVPYLWTAFPSAAARTLAVGSALLSVVGLVLAESRLGMLAAAVGVVGYLIVLAVERRWRVAIAGWTLAALPVAGAVAGLGAILVGGALGDRNSIARLLYWDGALEMLLSAPVFGVGVGRFGSHYLAARGPQVTRELELDQFVDSSHAWLVDVGATLGVVGLLLVVGALVLAGLVLRARWLAVTGPERLAIAVVAGLLAAHSAQAATAVPSPASVWLGGVLLALVVAVATPKRGRRGPARRGGKGPSKGSRAGTVLPRGVLLLVAAVGAGGSLFTAGALVVPTLTGSVELARHDAALSRDDQQAAFVLVQQAATRTAWWPQPQLALADLLASGGQLSPARQLTERAIDHDPRDLAAVRRAARFAAMSGDQESAARWFEVATGLDPYGVQTNIDVVEWALQAERPDAGRAAMERLDEVMAPGMPEWDMVQELRAEL